MDNPYPLCKNCIFADEPSDKDPCRECNRAFIARRIKPNFVRTHKPKSNADRIRAMSDEELAVMFFNYHFSFTCPEQGCHDCKESCMDCWLEWLKEEVKHEHSRSVPDER